jgi:hypothetical protein
MCVFVCVCVCVCVCVRACGWNKMEFIEIEIFADFEKKFLTSSFNFFTMVRGYKTLSFVSYTFE